MLVHSGLCQVIGPCGCVVLGWNIVTFLDVVEGKNLTKMVMALGCVPLWPGFHQDTREMGVV